MNFSEILTYWYSEQKRDLPWRSNKNPYCVWLSEIILQQTQVNQGLPYYNTFIKHFPTVFDLAKAPENKVLKLWQGLGYYSRARNLHFTAQYVVNELDGKFPTTYTNLIKLKGVGDYTASAIASICHEEPYAVLDGNVYRVLSRYFGIDTPINTTKAQKEFKTLAQSLLPKTHIGDYNQAIMEFGATLCKPKAPLCKTCPLNSSCIALKEQKVNALPVKLKKTKIKTRYFNYLVFIDSNKKTLIKQRNEKGIWKGLYEFPKIETNTSASYDDISSKIEDDNFSLSLFNEKEIIHKLSHQHLYTKFWIIEVDILPETAVLVSKLHSYPVPVLIQNFIEGFNF